MASLAYSQKYAISRGAKLLEPRRMSAKQNTQYKKIKGPKLLTITNNYVPSETYKNVYTSTIDMEHIPFQQTEPKI